MTSEDTNPKYSHNCVLFAIEMLNMQRSSNDITVCSITLDLSQNSLGNKSLCGFLRDVYSAPMTIYNALKAIYCLLWKDSPQFGQNTLKPGKKQSNYHLSWWSLDINCLCGPQTNPRLTRRHQIIVFTKTHTGFCCHNEKIYLKLNVNLLFFWLFQLQNWHWSADSVYEIITAAIFTRLLSWLNERG